MRSSKHTAPKRTILQRTGWWIFILVLLAAAGIWYFMGTPGVAFSKPTANATPSFYTTTVRRGDIQISASGSGTLVAGQSIDLSFSTGGTVSELTVKLGDKVISGQVLARVAGAESLQANIAAAQLAVVQNQQALNALQQNAQVALSQAFQTLIADQQKYNDALTAQQRTAYARCSKQVNTKNAQVLANATQKLSDLTANDYGSDLWLAAKGAYDTALANYNYCIAYTSDEKTNASSALDVARVNLQVAQKTYGTLNASKGVDPNQLALDQAKLAQSQTQLTLAKKQLEGLTLTAPFDGTVTYLAANQGAMVGTEKFITIADVRHPAVQVSLDETDLNKLKVGSSVSVVFDAMPEQNLTGKLTSVNPGLVTSGNVQVAQGLAQLDANSAQAVQAMPLGINASVTVIDQQARNALLIPIQALHDLGNNQYGVFVESGGSLQMHVVQVGLQDAAHAQILSGLNDGDVVSTGIAQVR